jgi:hypothetical protein
MFYTVISKPTRRQRWTEKILSKDGPTPEISQWNTSFEQALQPEENFVIVSSMWHIPPLPPHSNMRHTSCVMQCDIPTASDEWRGCTVPVCMISTYVQLRYQHNAHLPHHRISWTPLTHTRHMQFITWCHVTLPPIGVAPRLLYIKETLLFALLRLCLLCGACSYPPNVLQPT